MDDTEYMQFALAEARKAYTLEEVPIGALLVTEKGDIVSRTHNQVRTHNDPTSHAEILALRQGALHNMNYRLLNMTLYVTVEPCVMCMGAIIHARIARVVYGAKDPKWGGCGSLYDFVRDDRFNHRIVAQKGVCEKECRNLIQAFFREKRKTIKTGKRL